MAGIVAESIYSMRNIRSLNIADNNLYCDGICALIDAVIKTSSDTFVALDISENNFGSKSSRLLGDFLCSDKCRLSTLAVSHGDVDDGECNRFAAAISENGTLLELDLSHNKLGKLFILVCVYRVLAPSV